jgi:hypothetical protein
MEELNAFERQVANGLGVMGGPGRRIDAMAMVGTASTQSPKRRFQTMFSATKFVVAGVIVALFGGFLLTGVLTQQGEETTPIVGASASTQAEPTDVTTQAPERTAEAETDTSIRSDLLAGVDLVTEEVSPGVFRVFSDGAHDLSTNVWRVAVSPDGAVLVEKHRIARYKASEQAEVLAVEKDFRVLRLGEPGVSLPDAEGLQTRPDGTVTAFGPRGRFDGEAWVGEPAPRCGPVESALSSPDGSCWLHPGYERPDLIRIDADGQERVFTQEEIGATLRETGMSRALSAVDTEGTFWSVTVDKRGQPQVVDGLATFDGDGWTTVPLDEQIAGFAGFVESVDVAPDGSVWMVLSGFDGSLMAKTWDGTSWTTYGPVRGTFAPRGIHFRPDGTSWLGMNTLIDGSSDRQVVLPASPTNREPHWSVAHAPDGSVWVVAIDRHRSGPPRCPRTAHDHNCQGATDGLYVITPEAVAATE